MRLLITGGAGYLGSNLVERYLGGGHEILVLDNFATGKREVIPEVNGLKVVEGSVADAELVRRVFADFGPTHVIHSAAAYNDRGNWVEDVRTNVMGSINAVREFTSWSRRPKTVRAIAERARRNGMLERTTADMVILAAPSAFNRSARRESASVRPSAGRATGNSRRKRRPLVFGPNKIRRLYISKSVDYTYQMKSGR